MKEKYDILDSLPDTIEDDRIEKIEGLEQEIGNYTKSKNLAELFDLRNQEQTDGPDEKREV